MSFSVLECSSLQGRYDMNFCLQLHGQCVITGIHCIKLGNRNLIESEVGKPEEKAVLANNDCKAQLGKLFVTALPNFLFSIKELPLLCFSGSPCLHGL